jgi:23S rRNA (pseudouridine1915-N3)-methyltransferase
MLGIKLICVGKLKEQYYYDAAEEYMRRLISFCKLEVEELPESRLPVNPTAGDIENALLQEAGRIELRIPQNCAIITLCIEGSQIDSEQLSQMLEKFAISGRSRLCFIIGGSLGLHSRIKRRADFSLSMSRMTFPHHLARVMVLEQLYRAFQIKEGTRYHK